MYQAEGRPLPLHVNHRRAMRHLHLELKPLPIADRLKQEGPARSIGQAVELPEQTNSKGPRGRP